MAAEHNLWLSVRPALQEAGFFVQRIETTTALGVPDVWLGWQDGGYAWLELKAARAWPAREQTPVFGRDGLRPEQENWLLAAHRAGVRAFVLAGVGTGKGRTLYLVPASAALTFNGACRATLAQWQIALAGLKTGLQAAQK